MTGGGAPMASGRAAAGRLSVKFLLLVIPVVVLFTLGGASLLIDKIYSQRLEDMQDGGRHILQSTAIALGEPLWSLNGPAVQAIVSSLSAHSELACVEATDSATQTAYAWPQTGCGRLPGDFRFSAPITYAGEEVGRLVVTVSGKPLRHVLRRDILIGISLLCGLVLVTVLTTLVAHRLVIGRPLRRLLAAMRGGDGEARWNSDDPVRWNSDGQVRWNSDDEIGEVVAAYNDLIRHNADHIQALRQARRHAETASRAKSEFMAMMSHEIRTPMNGILGMTRLVRESPLTAEQQGHLEALLASGEGLMAVLNDILDYSKLEAGSLAFADEDFSLSRLTGEVETLIRPRAAAKGLWFTLRLQPDLPDLLRGDPLRLRQVLLHLLGNAVKFTAHGGVDLLVERDAAGTAPVPLRFSVRDSGVGIAEGERARLFQPFSQGDSTLSRRFGGTGLGLVICKGILDHQGGRIACDSQPGVGSCFTVSLGFALATTAETVPGPEPQAPPARSLRLLLAEDNPVNQRIAVAILRQRGHQVVAVADGQSAVETAAAGGFDLVLMDMRMPVMDGPEASRAIRALPHPAGRVPILGLTAADLAEQLADCLAAGMAEVLGKPFQPADLVERVERLAAVSHTGQ